MQVTNAKLRRMLLMVGLGAAVFTSQATGQTRPGALKAGGALDIHNADDITELRQEVRGAFARMDEMQKKLDIGLADSKFQLQLVEERTQLEALERRIDALGIADATRKADDAIKRRAETTPGITSGLRPADIYDDGFFVSSADKSFSMYLNGLAQIRYTGFEPQENVAHLGASTKPSSNFDVFLGRFATSGTVFSPTLKYFLQFEGSTVGNGNGVRLLDWFTAKTISKYLTVQVGRSWTPYTYEIYVNPGNLLLPDLSSAEYAFGLVRTVGVQAYGQAGKMSYGVVVGNSIPAFDASGQQNFNSKVSYMGHFQYDILAPYGYVESDPTSTGALEPALTIWASAAYNPVSASSGFENLAAGDKTVNGTSTIGFRYRRFTIQSTGYYRKTKPASELPAFNSWGFGEQVGLYVMPGKLELAGRVSGVNWGASNFLSDAISVNTWFSGPNFPYHRIGEDTLGLNFYFHGHHAKLQLAYSYLHGNTFDDRRYGASRVWVQSQVMF